MRTCSANSQPFRSALSAVALTSALAAAGCGVLPALEDLKAAVDVAEPVVLTIGDAAVVLFPEAEDAVADLDDEESLGDIAAEMGGVAYRDGGGLAMAPGAGADEPTVTRTIETGLRGRPLAADILIESAGGPRSRVHHQLAWIWSSGLDDSGDLDDAAPVDRGGPHGWRRIDATSETTWRTRDGDGVTSVTLAMRRDHTDPAVHAFRTAVTAIAPAHDKAPWQRMEAFGQFGLEATGVGRFSRLVEFADARTDEREWSLSVSEGVLAIDYRRTAPDGLTAAGEGLWQTAGTPCPLDDEGEWVLVREFPALGTEPTRPLRERVQRVQDGRVTVVSGELELADGRTLARAVTWTVEAPVDCSSRPAEIRLSFAGVGYGGALRSGEIVRSAEGWERRSRAELPDGRSVEAVVVRSGGVSVVTVRILAADGAILALLELSAAPGGPAVGTLTRFDGDGEVLSVSEVQREPDGRYRLQRPEGDELRWRRGQP